ncbi:hypothetical protein C8J42_102504 [Sphingomonas sp. PP-CE-1A-559]|uniref:hypothetical protein n=1 Tax=Sphingomonas sp. PP-CE-1A-559 TaxID=2135657 RepID=UPI0010565B0A|nr:hypothetical protein [Sphingomonas sp. PP-CE-1A-559]TCP92728.1 hypothetical protein C8J42_102504 [Sphingomonas sp. PP-CE-1A-559]
MTFEEETRKLFSNLIERMNRIEADFAHNKTVDPKAVKIEVDTSAVVKAIAQIESALSDIQARERATIDGK